MLNINAVVSKMTFSLISQVT